MLGRGVAERLATTRPSELWSPEIRAITSTFDLTIANLECCISERGQPTELIRGKPFFFRGPPSAVESLAAIGVNAVGLANNHALDFGPEALADTLRHLEAAGIRVAGAREGQERARRGIAVTGSDLTLGLVAVTDHPAQFEAGEGTWGVSYADLRAGVPAWLVDEIRRLRGECQLVVAFPHWGPNMTVRPAPWQVSVAAELLEAGADMVAGHSAHVFHGIEVADAGVIAYDLGDALDDYAVDRDLRNDLGVLVAWHRGAEGSWLELYGLHLDYCRTQLATGEDADWIASRLEHACTELGTAVERVGEQRFRVP